jgi:hypothetical protein
MNLGEAVVWWRWGVVFRILSGWLTFLRNQHGRVIPGPDYFVAGDGSVRRKYPRLHMTKKRRLGIRQPAKIRQYIIESRAALDWSASEIKRKDAALLDIRATIMAGKGFPAVMEKIREAI